MSREVEDEEVPSYLEERESGNLCPGDASVRDSGFRPLKLVRKVDSYLPQGLQAHLVQMILKTFRFRGQDTLFTL